MVQAEPDTDAASEFIKERHAARIAGYDENWSNLFNGAGIGPLVAKGTSLAQLLTRYEAVVGAYRGFVGDWLTRQVYKIDLEKFAGSRPPQRLAVMNGCYVALPAAPSLDAVFDAIAGVVDPEVDCIVEFGCGLGFNLARLRLRLPEVPLTYIACEPSEHGRRTAELIFSVDPQARLEARRFDYADADLSFLARFRKIVAFTVHSIEQMPVLGEGFYRALLDSNVSYCVHVEPVGWQRFTNLAETMRAILRDPQEWRSFMHHFKHEYVFVAEDARVVYNAAMWSAFCSYNTDLLSLVEKAAERGEVALTALAYEIVGNNPFNPSTVVAWRRTR